MLPVRGQRVLQAKPSHLSDPLSPHPPSPLFSADGKHQSVVFVVFLPTCHAPVSAGSTKPRRLALNPRDAAVEGGGCGIPPSPPPPHTPPVPHCAAINRAAAVPGLHPAREINRAGWASPAPGIASSPALSQSWLGGSWRHGEGGGHGAPLSPALLLSSRLLSAPASSQRHCRGVPAAGWVSRGWRLPERTVHPGCAEEPV